MKLFVVLLAVGLSASEKLNHAYLPPPEALLAGGSLEDLQTPLEYPKESPTFGSKNTGKAHVEYETHRPEFPNGISRLVDFDAKTGIPGVEKVSPIITEASYGYTSAHLKSGFEMTGIPRDRKMEYTIGNIQNGSPSLRYPLNGQYTEKDGIFYYWNSGDHSEKTDYKPIIAIPKGIMQNYDSKDFGMYGGNPMIIKSYLEIPQNLRLVTKFRDYNETHISDDISTSDETFSPNPPKSVKYDATRISSTPNPRISPEVTQYVAITAKPDITKVSQKNNKAQRYLQKRPERPQAAFERTAAVLNYENVQTPEGYVYSYNTTNGIHRAENASTLDSVRAQGSYSYTGDDGKIYSITYSADENGFQATGDHLPTPPPIPEAIQKVIEQANKDAEAGIFHDGSYDEERYGHMKYQGPIHRYLHNKQENLRVKNRNRVLRPRKLKINEPIIDLMKEYEVYNKNVKNVHNNYDHRPENDSHSSNLNLQFGLKSQQYVQKSKSNLGNSQNGENGSRHRLIPAREEDNFKPRLRKPSVHKLVDEAKKDTVNKNESLQRSTTSNRKYKGSYNNRIMKHLNSMTSRNSYRNQVATKSSFDENKRLAINVPENGYYYVPPQNMFIEGEFTSTGNLDIKSVPVTGFYYVDRNDNKHHELSKKVTNYFKTTEKPFNHQTYGGNFYESTNHKVYQSIERTSTEITSDENIVIVTTVKPYGKSLTINSYDQAYEGIALKENTFPFTRNDLSIANYRSTTPMPSELKYKSQLLNQYPKTYPSKGIDNTLPSSAADATNEGYFGTIPSVPETFSDLPTSTYKPIETVNRFQTEQTPNIKVDGFGRPIQDTSSSLNTNSPSTSEYYTNSIQMDDEFRTNGELRTTASYSSEYEENIKGDKATPLEDSKSTSSGVLSEDVGSDEENVKLNYFDNKEVTSIDKIVGEDFSGPKQSQRYDPDTGYFY